MVVDARRSSRQKKVFSKKKVITFGLIILLLQYNSCDLKFKKETKS